MAPAVVGVATMGHAPRTDLMPGSAAPPPPGTRVIERGALDHIGLAELASLAPGLRRGSAGHPAAGRHGSDARRGQAHAAAAGSDRRRDRPRGGGRGRAVHRHTGGHPLPAAAADARPAGQEPGRRGGAGGPHRPAGRGGGGPPPAKTEPVRADWSAAAGEVMVLAASPYGPLAGLAEAADALAAWRPDLVVLDCLGFDGPMEQMVAWAVGVPVILPRTVLAGALAALLCRLATRGRRGLARASGRRRR